MAKRKSKKNHSATDVLEFANFIFLFANLFLIISSYWFEYTYFYTYVAIVCIPLALSLFISKIIPQIGLAATIAFYATFIYFNLNYTLILLISIILGTMALHLLKPNLKIPPFIYSLIPLLILLHIIWFNFLPFGFEGEWNLNVGTLEDDKKTADIYLIDERNVLSPTQSYDDNTWRTFEKDGTFELGFNTPINLENKTIELEMQYEATGPIYINNQLFYDPSWGTAVNLGDFGEEFIYGAEKFNLTIPYKNTQISTFLAVTNYSSIEQYIFDRYNINILEHQQGTYLGKTDLWTQREEMKEQQDLSILASSQFFKLEEYNQSLTTVSQLLNQTGLTIDEILRTPLEVFLLEKQMTLSEFMDFELNNGPYPREKPLNDKYKTVEQYIRGYFPNGVPLKDFTGKYPQLEEEMNAKYLQSINTPEYYSGWSDNPKTLQFSIRGPVTYYAIFKDKIELDMMKQDMNLYNGSDAVTILVTDFDNNIIANWTITDNDNIITRDTQNGESQFSKYIFSTPLEKPGIYKMEFYHKYENDNPDFIISNITINSNKAIIDGSFMLWSPGTLYNYNQINNVRVRYWWSGFDQKITFNDNSVLQLTPFDRGSYVNVDLTNKNSLEFEKGYLVIDPQFNFAVWENSNLDTNVLQTIQITKSIDIENKNIQLVKVQGINITGTQGTKISSIKITTK